MSSRDGSCASAAWWGGTSSGQHARPTTRECGMVAMFGDNEGTSGNANAATCSACALRCRRSFHWCQRVCSGASMMQPTLLLLSAEEGGRASPSGVSSAGSAPPPRSRAPVTPSARAPAN